MRRARERGDAVEKGVTHLAGRVLPPCPDAAGSRTLPLNGSTGCRENLLGKTAARETDVNVLSRGTESEQQTLAEQEPRGSASFTSFVYTASGVGLLYLDPLSLLTQNPPVCISEHK